MPARSIERRRLTGALAIALCAVMGFGQIIFLESVMADGGPASGDSGLEEIVVSVPRRAERLQDIPVSATAFTQEKPDVQGLRSIDDLTRLTPGITFTS